MIYGSTLVPMWLIQGLLGLCFYALSYLRDATLKSWCPTSIDENRFMFYEQAREVVVGVDEKLFRLSGYYMCSPQCPCPKIVDGIDLEQEYIAAIVAEDAKSDTKRLSLFERTVDPLEADYKEFSFIDTETDSTTVFTSFKECYEKTISGQNPLVQDQIDVTEFERNEQAKDF